MIDTNWSLTVSTGPTDFPVSYQEALEHLRLDTNDEMDTVNALIRAATDHVERFTHRALMTQTLVLKLDEWPTLCDSPYFIELPRPPLQSVTSITYLDADNVSQTWASTNYTVDTNRTPGRVALAYNKSLPDTLSGVANAITVTYVAGYATRAAVPESIKLAIRLLIGHWFENREDSVTGTIQGPIERGVSSLLWPYRVKRFV